MGVAVETMAIGETMLQFADWTTAQVLRGTGSELAAAIDAFITCKDQERIRDLWWGIEGAMFSQNTLYGAAEPAVDVLLGALADDRPVFVKSWIIEALRFVLTSGSTDDPYLASRCHERASRGTWLLATVARQMSGPDREAAIDLLQLIDPTVANVVRAALVSSG